MATPETSKGLKGKTDEDASNVKPVSKMNDLSLINNETVSKDNTQNINVITDEELPTDTKDGITNFNDVVSDGTVLSRKKEYVYGRHDDEVQTSTRVKLYSCNQKPANNGRFLKMALEHAGHLSVTTTGVSSDPYALWVTHFTVDEKLRQVVIFENWKCSERTGKKCVLYTHQVGADYTLTGKKIDKIPKILEEIEPKIGFFKHPKATGSELLYFKSMLTTKERPLMVGFDGVGQPIPMNRVIKYSSDFQAFFKILEAG